MTSVETPKPNTSISSAVPNRPKPSRIGSRSSSRRLADRIGQQPPQAEPGARRRRAVAPDRRSPCRRSAAVADAQRSRRLLEIADEGVLERGDAARLDQLRRRVGRQHAAGIHQRYPVAALRLVHEMGRDENRHALIARKVDQQLPRTGPAPADRRPRSARRESASPARGRWRRPATAAGECRAADPSVRWSR